MSRSLRNRHWQLAWVAPVVTALVGCGEGYRLDPAIVNVDDINADRNFKPPVRTKSAHLDTLVFRVASLMLRPSLGAACLTWAIRAAGAPPRRAPGH